MPTAHSEILAALYARRDAEARRLAAAAETLTIWEAAALGDDEQVQRVLEKSPSANGFAPDGHTPLGLASFFGRPSTVRLLLEHGADVHAPSRNEMMVQPLHAAVAGRNIEVVRLLLAHGADVNARQQAGYTPLMGAAAAGREDLVDLLLERGADPSVRSGEGTSAAQVAQERGFNALAERLTSE